MSNPANEDVGAYLTGQTLASVTLTLNGNLFLAGPQQVQTGVPSQAVFCQLYGGYGAPTRYLQGPAQGGTNLQAREPRVMIFVRGNPHDYAGAQALARAVKDYLHDFPPSGYDAGRIEESEPLYLYQTDSAEFVFSMSYHLYLDA